jgi:hypothetical protein
MRRVLFMLPAERARAALAALATVASIATLGCEDGPIQLYQPSPAGAGSVWNSGNPAPAANDAGQSFEAGYPTANKTVLCSTDFKRQRWAWMLKQPITPPRLYAGLDMAFNDQWLGLTIDEAEAPPTSGDPTDPKGGLCQSVPLGFQGTCPSGFGGCNGNYWGNNLEVVFNWNVATHIVDQMDLSLGYTGTIKTKAYPDHTGESHYYEIAVGDVFRRDGAPFEIPWTAAASVYDQVMTDIFNAEMATFAPNAGIPFDTSMCTKDSDCTAANNKCQCDHTGGTNGACATGKSGQCGNANCGSDGNCLIADDGSNTYFGVRPLVVYVVGQAGLPQPALSTPTLIYNFNSKWLPFSYLPQTVTLDADGPIASGTPIGANPATLVCTQAIGQTFDQFTKNCVQVTGNATVDTVNLNKVTHGLVHDQEHWTANVLGVNQNFTSSKVAANPNIVVLDTDTPGSGDVAQDWTFDVRARGHTINDFGPTRACAADADCPSWDTCNTKAGTCYGGAGNGALPSERGSELLFIEFARELLADMASVVGGTPHALGDPACVGFTNGVPNYQINNADPKNSPCTGVEGMIIPSSAWLAQYGLPPAGDFTGDASCQAGSTVPCLDPGGNADAAGYYPFVAGVESFLKPGAATGELCIDPPSNTDCTANSGQSFFQNILTHVTRVLGAGSLSNLPSELQDRRYYFKFFGQAYIKYLKAYGNYMAKYPMTVDNFPVAGTAGSGLSPTDVMNQPIDLESLFFDYAVEPGAGAAQSFDKFEYIDRDFIGQGAGGTDNYIPWDFSYGCDLFAGNQRYDDWYRRMDREEIALYSAMLAEKTHTPGQENNVNITNLFGSLLLGGNPAAAVPGIFNSYACAVGTAGDPTANCVNPNSGVPTNAPLDTSNPSNADQCGSGTNGAGCNGSQVCAGGSSFENGFFAVCGDACDFTTYPLTGCKSATQTCAAGTGTLGCVDMKMDKNGPGAKNPLPLMYQYPGVWSQTPFSRGHSSITLAAADKHPDIGVAKVSIPNFTVDPANRYTTGPYTVSPVLAGAGATPCPTGFTLSANKVWCNGPVNSGTGTMAPAFTPLTPWAEVQPEVGFPIPLDAQHSQWVAGGQLDFTGVLESYLVDYVPYADPAKGSCINGGGTSAGAACKVDTDCPGAVCSGQTKTCVPCHDGYACDPVAHTCNTTDNTININAIEGADFLGQAFVCQDPSTGDILHVGMYDSALAIVDWLAAHPGTSGVYGITPSAQAACQILVIRSPYDNYVDFIVSKSWGVTLNISGGQGQGRITDIVLFDPTLIQDL